MLVEASRTREEEKLKRLRNATVNLLEMDIEEVWAGSLAQCVAEVATHEVALLRLFHDTDKRRDAGNDFVESKTLAEKAGLPMRS
jgi:hypothetical protein